MSAGPRMSPISSGAETSSISAVLPNSGEVISGSTGTDKSSGFRPVNCAGRWLGISNSITYRGLQAIFDILAVITAYWLTVDVRILLNPLMTHQLTEARMQEVAPNLGILVVLWIVAALAFRLYRRRSEFAFGESLLHAAKSMLIVSTLMAVVTFFSRHLGADLSRSFVLLFAGASFITVLIARYCTVVVATVLLKRWPQTERLAIAGHGPEALQLADHIRMWSGQTTQIVGVVIPQKFAAGGEEDQGAAAGGLRILGSTSQLAELINREGLDRLIVANGSLEERELSVCMRTAKRMGVIASHALWYAESDVRVSFSNIYGMPLLEIHPVSFTRWQELVKRCIDVVSSVSLLILLAPVMALLAMAIKLTSRGPVLYKSTRVGRGGRYFTFLKFRSMHNKGLDRAQLEAQNQRGGHIFKIRNDPRVTPLGRFLRRYSLDELPQLINVLLGDMSLVGPRPLPAMDLDPDGMSRNFRLWAEQRSQVKPGITGLWQVRGRSDLPFEQMVLLDMDYIRTWSLALDLRIFLETPLAVFSSRGAY
ncbi:MAG: sugar transferase [Bryobacteraceae bacterium]